MCEEVNVTCNSLGRSVTLECEDCNCDSHGSICSSDCESFKKKICSGCYIFDEVR